MAKFKFRLATLLRLREVARDERRADLAQAYHADEIIAEQEQQLGNELKAIIQRGREVAGPGTLDVDRLLETRRYEVLLKANREHLGQQRETLQTEIERRRLIVVEANREVRVLEELEAKQRERHREEEGRKEVKMLDEMAQRRTPLEEVQ